MARYDGLNSSNVIQQQAQEIAEYRHQIHKLKEEIRSLESQQFLNGLTSDDVLESDTIEISMEDRMVELETAVNDIRNYLIGGQNI